MNLQTHTIKAAKGSRKKRRRLGRGNASGRGNFSGRGMKGQRSRSGGKSGLKRRGFKQLLQSTPKLRGFKSLNVKPTELRLSDLEKNFADGEVVNLKILKEKEMVGKLVEKVKLLATGELKKKLTLEGILYTANAAKAVKKAGGDVK